MTYYFQSKESNPLSPIINDSAEEDPIKVVSCDFDEAGDDL
jgi:hypothetical protein